MVKFDLGGNWRSFWCWRPKIHFFLRGRRSNLDTNHKIKVAWNTQISIDGRGQIWPRRSMEAEGRKLLIWKKRIQIWTQIIIISYMARLRNQLTVTQLGCVPFVCEWKLEENPNFTAYNSTTTTFRPSKESPHRGDQSRRLGDPRGDPRGSQS